VCLVGQIKGKKLVTEKKAVILIQNSS